MSLTLFLRHGHIRLLVLYRTNQPLQIVDGIHSISIVWFTPKLLRQGIQEEDLAVVAATVVATKKAAMTMTAGKMS